MDFLKEIEDQIRYEVYEDLKESKSNTKFVSNRSVLKKYGKYQHTCNGKKCKDGIKSCKFHKYYCDYGEGITRVKHDRSWKNYRKTQYIV